MSVKLSVIAKAVSRSVIGSVLVTENLLPYEYSFDNVDDYVVADTKVFDLANPEFELEGYFDLENYDGTLFSQNVSSTSGEREFQIYKLTSGGIKLVVGGSLRTILNDGALHNQKGLWVIRLYGNSVDGFNIDVKLDGVLLSTTGWSSVGADSEPTALPMLAGRTAGSSGGVSSLLGGVIKDFKFWKGGDRDTGSLVLDLPINEGPAGNVTNLVGSILVSAVGFNSERWTQV